MKAEIEVDCENPEMVIKSIEPDMDKNNKFEVKLEAKKDKIEIKIKAKDTAGLLAGINSYLRLIKTTKDMEEIK